MNKILSLILIVISVLSFSACNKTPAQPVNNTPKTIMDMFDGERKIWYIVDETNALSYNSTIRAVFVTENKQVTDGYYYIPYDDPKYYDAKIEFWTQENPIHQFCYKKFTLSDFDNLTDEQIISKLQKNYANVSKTYTLTPFVPDSGPIFYHDFKANNLPVDITYSGILDNSGNNLKEETIILFDTNYLYTHYGFFYLIRIITLVQYCQLQ